jgi:hypothetical protein
MLRGSFSVPKRTDRKQVLVPLVEVCYRSLAIRSLWKLRPQDHTLSTHHPHFPIAVSIFSSMRTPSLCVQVLIYPPQSQLRLLRVLNRNLPSVLHNHEARGACSLSEIETLQRIRESENRRKRKILVRSCWCCSTGNMCPISLSFVVF